MEKLIFFVIFALCGSAVAQEAILNLPNGPIRGEKHPDFYSFKGLPYAEPPIGAKRFQPVGLFRGRWEDVRNATEFGEICLQWRETTAKKLSGQEDCLFLNVYTPQVGTDVKLPVIVHFHGGGFTYGSGTFFSPERMLQLERVVFVSVNYRLGPLGFLSTEDDVVPGNMGLKDQAVALQWIQENIHLFGGDRESVTLSGFSAGGASVHLHYLSPHSAGLFHRGISHSGCALNPWVLAENSREKAKFLANHLGCPTENVKEMINCLRGKPAEDIVGCVPLFQPWPSQPFTPFGVVVEKDTKDPFLPAHPDVLYKTEKFSKLPWIVGYTDADGVFPAAEFLLEPTMLDALQDRWSTVAPFVLDFNGTTTQGDHEDLSHRILRFYLGNEKLSRETFSAFVTMLTDRIFATGIGQCARLHSQGAPTYLYRYDYPAIFGIWQIYLGVDARYNGAGHGDDVFVLLRNKNDPRDEQTPAEKEMCRLLTQMYVSFAKDPHPTVGDVTFAQVNAHGFASFLHIRSPTNISMALEENVGEEDFWQSLPIEESGFLPGGHPARNTIKGEL